MENYRNSLADRQEIIPAAVNNTSWLASIDNEFQALVGFGACVAQGVIGITQMLTQSEISVAKIDAESRVAQSNIENSMKLQVSKVEAEAKIISSMMPLIHDEIKRLGGHIDKISTLLLDKFTATDLTKEQIQEKEKLERMMEQDQLQLDKLLQYAMTHNQTT